MKSSDEPQIQKLVEDIGAIKQVLANSRPSLQLFFLPIHFRFQTLFTGLCIILLAGAYQFLIGTFGSYTAIPETYRYVFCGLIFAAWLCLLILKYVNWKRSIARIDSRYDSYSPAHVFRELFSFRIIHSVSLFVLTLIFFIIYWITIEQSYYIIPTLGIGIGILLAIMGNLTGITHYIVFGWWVLLWALGLIVYTSISGAIAIMIVFGGGLLIFSLYAFLKDPRGEE